MVFLNVEDEGALTNVICSPGFWLRYRRELLCAGIIVRGRLERAHGVISVVAERAEELILDAGSWRSRDFH
jgi:error-prone DNA polymerase